MPEDSAGCSSVLEFLIKKFPRIEPDIWLQRIKDGKVQWDDGSRIELGSPYTPKKRIFYYREVEQEPVIPFCETILHQDDNLLVADKPHFLPVTPGGRYVKQCLLYRLRKSTGLDHLSPIHRIDRWTAGVVMFSTNSETRSLYQNMFKTGCVKKSYNAIASIAANTETDPKRQPKEWMIENRIVQGNPGFRMSISAGEINARTRIKCVAIKDGKGLFHLYPLTGKTHQLRLHMSGLGMPILNERYYPELQPESADDFKRPLQLLAKRLEFVDPITAETKTFSSLIDLAW